MESTILKDELDCASESNAWWYLPSLIKFLRKSRHENFNEMYCMNISIILHSATIIEGFLTELLSEFIGENSEDSSLEDRINHELNQRIDRSSWGDLQYLYKLIFGNYISQDSNNDTWKVVCSLFDFRNMLTHGKVMRLSVFYENGIRRAKMFGKYENVYNFLANEKKKIKKVNLKAEFPSVELITNDTVDLYWEGTISFLNQIFKKRKKQVPSIKNSYAIAFKYS